MPSIFTKIINGELPGRFVHRDDEVVAFLTIAPVRPGHTLVVPVQEIDSWLDVPDSLRDRLFEVSQRVGAAIDRAFKPKKVALLLLGLEVPHAHVHLLPIDSEAQVDFSKADGAADPAALDEAAERIRAELG